MRMFEFADPPIPETLETIPDASFRQRASDAFRSARRLCHALSSWDIWLSVWQSDVGMAGAIMLEVQTQVCITALLEIGARIQSFGDKPLPELLRQFPSVPRGSINAQRDAEFRRRTQEQLPALHSIEQSILEFLDLLEIAPSAALSPSIMPNHARPEAETTKEPDREKKPRSEGINKRMQEALVNDAEKLGWSTEKWRLHLGCKSKATVHATKTWQNIMKLREKQKRERLEREAKQRAERD
jgi:hypothetical protein